MQTATLTAPATAAAPVFGHQTDTRRSDLAGLGLVPFDSNRFDDLTRLATRRRQHRPLSNLATVADHAVESTPADFAEFTPAEITTIAFDDLPTEVQHALTAAATFALENIFGITPAEFAFEQIIVVPCDCFEFAEFTPFADH